MSAFIERIAVTDLRYPLPPGAGSDAVHVEPEYCLAVTQLLTGDGKLSGTGFALTLGEGNKLVCDAIEMLARPLQGRAIDELMADFGATARLLADDPILRWLGPHKGVVHLALASITNACFDLWAKARGVPLWRLLLDLEPEQLVRLLDLSYLEDIVDEKTAIALVQDERQRREQRSAILQKGYPGYDTSVGWMAYDDAKVRELTKQALDKGFGAFKLKVGSRDQARDLRRAAMLRECAGEQSTIMFDANQQWTLPAARSICRELAKFKPLWIEEPTHPDDIAAHIALARELAPVRIACGEHIPNRIVFKNFVQQQAMHYVQADCTRLAGVSEFLAVGLLAKKFDLPIVPHVGDMGQIHQHLVLFLHIALGNELVFLEHIPHLSGQFAFPAEVRDGRYRTPEQPGSSTDLRDLATK